MHLATSIIMFNKPWVTLHSTKTKSFCDFFSSFSPTNQLHFLSLTRNGSSLFQRLHGGLEEKNVHFINGEIQEASEGMCHIWAEAGSNNAMPSRAICWVELLQIPQMLVISTLLLISSMHMNYIKPDPHKQAADARNSAKGVIYLDIKGKIYMSIDLIIIYILLNLLLYETHKHRVRV